MFVIDKEKIGIYVRGLIDLKYPSRRQFGIKCLELKNDPNIKNAKDDAANNENKRLQKIVDGKQDLQLDDLVVFSELLNVSIEKLLSAGECGETKNERQTNYSVAQSADSTVWQSYIDIDDKPILNPDEYGKTIIDYAICFKNYELLKYLVNNSYIWFDSENINDYVMTFGAGTSIKRTEYITDTLQTRLARNDSLRISLILLAIDNTDKAMLNKLRARELPEIYFRARYPFYSHPNFDIRYDKTMEELVKHISEAKKSIIEYFTSPFEICEQTRDSDGNPRKHTFVFPYISQLLDRLIHNNDKSYLPEVLEKAVEHNESVFNKLNELINSDDADASNNSIYMFKFSENGNIVSFANKNKAMITNVIRLEERSDDEKIKELINSVNELAMKISSIKTGRE